MTVGVRWPRRMVTAASPEKGSMAPIPMRRTVGVQILKQTSGPEYSLPVGAHLRWPRARPALSTSAYFVKLCLQRQRPMPRAAASSCRNYSGTVTA